MISIKNYTELEDDRKTILQTHINSEFGHIPIVKEFDWAEPNWTICKLENSEIVAFYNIVERIVTFDDQQYKAAGINNIITPVKHRKKGHALTMLMDTEDFIFNTLKADIGLLLCADALIPFYKRLGWCLVDSEVRFKQNNDERIWQANTMLLIRSQIIHPKKINLNGLPW